MPTDRRNRFLPADGTTHFFKVVCQFSTTVKGTEALCATGRPMRKRLPSAMALLLGLATLFLAVGCMSTTARAQDGTPAPVQGSWLATITRTTSVGVSFTALVSVVAGRVWQAAGADDRITGGVSSKALISRLQSKRGYRSTIPFGVICCPAFIH
jgi:hypothetical protein